MIARRAQALAAVAVVVLAAVVGAPACSSGGSTPHAKPAVLDGRPRYPDDEGIITEASRTALRVDTRRYRISDQLQVFSTATGQTVSLVGRVNQYAQVGLDGKRVVWVALYSAVVQLPGRPVVAFHIGRVIRMSKGRAIFQDGSVLRVANGMNLAKLPAYVRAEIDIKRHQAVSLTVLSD